ncbi:hypothetical protein [uncultured Desulfuromusa sp.]|uniref:hypothetical protein n=1 Tax=uncultured Desulfuromusa sp. TaxID=219183 RepID=UPI002AA8CDC8|nr:hypothetical protein [uncultured Desulfuromusa sp.]
MKKFLVNFLILVTAVVLSSCGGGQEGSGITSSISPETDVDTEQPEKNTVSIIFAHHSMGALLLGSRTYTDPREYSPPEDMFLCRRLDELNEQNSENVQLFHHDRAEWNSLRDCNNNFVEESWGNVAMGDDGNTPSHWQRVFIENQWPSVREKFLNYDIIVIKNSYQTVQDEHSPDYLEDPAGAYTILDKMEEWKSNLVALAEYFSTQHPDKILVHLGPAPRRGLSTEGTGIHYPVKEVADASRAFSDWMSNEWTRLAPNVRYFPWFDYLANSDNVMDERWRSDGSHYELWRGEEIGLVFADYLFEIAGEVATQ